MTQGGLLSPTISNVVVDAFLRKWVAVVSEMEVTEEPGTEGF